MLTQGILININCSIFAKAKLLETKTRIARRPWLSEFVLHTLEYQAAMKKNEVYVKLNIIAPFPPNNSFLFGCCCRDLRENY